MAIKVIQLFEKDTSTYTYLVYDITSKEAVIIDSTDTCFARDSKFIDELGLNLKYTIETHIHADHISASYMYKEKYKAKIAVSEKAGSTCADIAIKDGQKLPLGLSEIQCIATPGHTSTCVSYLMENNIFTGDALLINGCGRTDFQEGSSHSLFKSVREKLFTLPDATVIYPGHDYNGFTTTTIGHQKEYNPRLKITNTYEDFESIMKQLRLSKPKKIDIAMPANLNCGKKI